MVRCWILRAGIVLVMTIGAVPLEARAVECWRGWGYWTDGQTRAYKSQELLLVTEGAVEWAPGQSVVFYQLDRGSGAIRRDLPPIRVQPAQPRVYYRGRSNYVDGEGAVEGTDDRLVFGLHYVAPATAGLARMAEHVEWACGRAAEGNFRRP